MLINKQYKDLILIFFIKLIKLKSIIINSKWKVKNLEKFTQTLYSSRKLGKLGGGKKYWISRNKQISLNKLKKRNGVKRVSE